MIELALACTGITAGGGNPQAPPQMLLLYGVVPPVGTENKYKVLKTNKEGLICFQYSLFFISTFGPRVLKTNSASLFFSVPHYFLLVPLAQGTERK